MGMGNATHANDLLFDRFISYIQKNYRLSLYGKDYEILTEIFNNCDLRDLDKAIDYAKVKTDSLIYLQKILNTKEYQKNQKPSWLNEEIKAVPMSEAELKEMEELLREFQ